MPSRAENLAVLVQRNPENELFRFSFAQALVSEGRDIEALEHFAFCIEKKSDWMMPRILQGKLLLSRGRVREARPLLEDALRLAVEQNHEDPEHELRALLHDLPPA